MSFDVKQSKASNKVFSMIRTASAEELTAYEKYLAQNKNLKDTKHAVINPSKPRIDPGPALNLQVAPVKKELAAYEDYKKQIEKENFLVEEIGIIKSETTRTDKTVGISNRDTKVKPIRPAIQNQISERDFLK